MCKLQYNNEYKQEKIYKNAIRRKGKLNLRKIKEWLRKEVHQYYIQKLDAEQKDYLEVVSNYIEYYNRRALRCKMSFYGTNLVKILGLSGVTLAKIIGENADKVDFSTSAAIITTMCLVLEGVNALFRWQEKWILYRNAQNALMREIRQFVVKEGIYQEKENSFSFFVEMVESIIDDEARKWNSCMKEQKEQKNEEETGRVNNPEEKFIIRQEEWEEKILMGENCCMQESIKCYIPLTIERKLKAYSESSNHIERHEILWHEWNHNKRWLTQVQELILPSFPSYSRHDSSHSEAIIHNIEMLLGEENINELSATDCFAILHTVYIHDIGMCITHADREAILKNKRFCEYLKIYVKVLIQI